MARVTGQEVLDVMPTDTELTSVTVLPFITSANVFVTSSLSSAGLSDDVLKEIERWLSAHMATVSKDRVSKEEGAGGAYIKWAGKWEDELASTQFGQMVLMLDTSNTLRNLKDGKKQASINVVEGV